MKERIKKYIEKEIKTNKALKEKYDESKLDECVKYLFARAQKLANGARYACQPSDIVYMWVRHFFLDLLGTKSGTWDLNEIYDDDVENTTEYEETEVKEAVEAQQKAPEQPAKKRLGELEQLDLFASVV